MNFGIHLPHSGPVASADAIRSVAKHAEDLGFSDVWVSDHVALPKGAKYPPSSYILEPLISLTWAAAATERIGLGTSVLVLPIRPPVLLAKMLGSLDIMSGGRLTIGAACGWLEREFEALAVPYADRGARADECIDILRRCWTEDPIDFEGPITGTTLKQMRLKPDPGRKIPIWIGGNSEPAFRRAVTLGDGWHGAFQNAKKAAPSAKRLRAERPEDSFTLSMRTTWDALRDDADELARELDAFSEAGFQHLVVDPVQRDIDAWLRCADEFKSLFRSVGLG